jgi:hypothetical protein
MNAASRSQRPKLSNVLLVLLLMNSAGCQGVPEVRFIVPDGFSGPLIIVEDESGVTVSETAGVYEVVFPESGVLRVTDDNFVRDEHHFAAFRASGETIPLYPEGYVVEGLFGGAFTSDPIPHTYYFVGSEQFASSFDMERYWQEFESESEEVNE